MQSRWDGTDSNAAGADEVLTESCDEFAAAMWAHHMAEDAFEWQVKYFRMRCTVTNGNEPDRLASVQRILASWFFELDREDQEHFANVFELQGLKIDSLLPPREARKGPK